MKRATILAIGGPLVAGSRSWGKAALASRRPSPRHQDSPGDCRVLARLQFTFSKCDCVVFFLDLVGFS